MLPRICQVLLIINLDLSYEGVSADLRSLWGLRVENGLKLDDEVSLASE